MAGLFSAQLAFLVLRTQSALFKTRAAAAADSLSLVATSSALVLSFLDHQRSHRPSTLLSLYLSASAILGIARVRTLWLLASGGPVPPVMTVVFVLTVFALLVQSIERESSASDGPQSGEKLHSPERRSGFWTRTCFIWLASTFRLGHSKVISIDDLPALDTKLQSQKLRKKLVSAWDKCTYNPVTLPIDI